MKSESIENRKLRIQERYVEDMANLDAELKIAGLCPIPPKMVHFASKPEPWITYEVESVAEAARVLAAYPVLPGSAIEDGCVYVGPQPRERGTLRWRASELVEVVLEHGKGYQSREMTFWTPWGEGAARIKVRIEKWPWKVTPQCRVTYDTQGNVRDASHSLADQGEWKRIKWGAGSREACRFALYFETREQATAWLARIAEAT